MISQLIYRVWRRRKLIGFKKPTAIYIAFLYFFCRFCLNLFKIQEISIVNSKRNEFRTKHYYWQYSTFLPDVNLGNILKVSTIFFVIWKKAKWWNKLKEIEAEKCHKCKFLNEMKSIRKLIFLTQIYRITSFSHILRNDFFLHLFKDKHSSPYPNSKWSKQSMKNI